MYFGLQVWSSALQYMSFKSMKLNFNLWNTCSSIQKYRKEVKDYNPESNFHSYNYLS